MSDLTLAKIKYAIDHETGVLENHTQKTLELNEKAYLEDVQIKSGESQFMAQYTSNGDPERFHIEIGRGGVFRVTHENTSGVSLKFMGKDLRSVEFELRNSSTRRVTRNEIDKKTGEVKKRQYTSLARSAGLTPDLLVEVADSLRSLIRNRENGVTSASRRRAEDQRENTRKYQNERQEALRSLRVAIRTVQEALGVSDTVKGLPSTNVPAVQSYIKTELKKAGKASGTLGKLSEVLKRHKLFTEEDAKSVSKTMIDTAKLGETASKDYLDRVQLGKSEVKESKNEDKNSNIHIVQEIYRITEEVFVPYVYKNASEYARVEFQNEFYGNMEDDSLFLLDPEQFSETMNTLSEDEQKATIGEMYEDSRMAMVTVIKAYLGQEEGEHMFSGGDVDISRAFALAKKSNKGKIDELAMLNHKAKKLMVNAGR